MIRLSSGRCGIAAALAALVAASVADAHTPLPGSALEHTTEVAGHVVEVLVVPKQPLVGEQAEVILTIWQRDTGKPYRGHVTFRVTPPTGEPGPPAVPPRFGPGRFESAHAFLEPGLHGLSVALDVEGAERLTGPITVMVRSPSRAPAGVALILALVTASTYAAAFRYSRRRFGGWRGR